MGNELVKELLDLGILEGIKYTDSEVADAAGEDLPSVSVTKDFMMFLYEMKKPFTDNQYITDKIDERRRSDIRRAIYLWLIDQGVEESPNLEGMTNTVNRFVMNIVNKHPVLGQMNVRKDIDSQV